ncbi:MAG: MarR family transcriptional regulator [Pseudomonadota bacterium]
MLSIEERFSMGLHTAARAWRQALDRRLKHLGVGQASWMAIAMVAKSKQALAQNELANLLGVEAPTMVAMVDRLVKLGLVRRVASETDRRVKQIVLTDDGLALYAKVKTEADAFRVQLLRKVDHEHLRVAADLLEALSAACESM